MSMTNFSRSRGSPSAAAGVLPPSWSRIASTGAATRSCSASRTTGTSCSWRRRRSPRPERGESIRILPVAGCASAASGASARISPSARLACHPLTGDRNHASEEPTQDRPQARRPQEEAEEPPRPRGAVGPPHASGGRHRRDRRRGPGRRRPRRCRRRLRVRLSDRRGAGVHRGGLQGVRAGFWDAGVEGRRTPRAARSPHRDAPQRPASRAAPRRPGRGGHAPRRRDTLR